MSRRARPRPWAVLGCALALAGATPACRSRDAPRADDGWFFPADALPARAAAGAWCRDEPPSALAGAVVPVRLFVGAGVDAAALRPETDALQAYFARYGVRFAGGAPSAVDVHALLAGTRESVRAELARAGLAGTSPEELADADRARRVRQVTSEAVARPMADFLRAHSAAAGAVIDIVLVERIMTPDSPLGSYVGGLAGLTMTPETAPATPEAARSFEDTMADFREALGLERFTTTIFLSRTDLVQLAPARRRTLLAHEMGHALGLWHARDRASLMAVDRRTDCVPALGDEARATVARALAALAARAAPPGPVPD